MRLTEVIDLPGMQVVRMPDDFRFVEHQVMIRKAGNAVIIEPVKLSTWPADFFEEIQIDDPAFTRPEQGSTPPIPAFDVEIDSPP